MRKTSVLGALFLGVCLLPMLTQQVLAVETVTLFNPLGVTDPREIIGNLIKAILSIIGSLTLLMFVYGGVLWITSMGEPKKIQKGKDIIVWTTAGLAIVIGAYVLANAVILGLTTGSVTPTAGA